MPLRPCSGCGKPIPGKRLELFPDAQLCVPCLEASGDVSVYSGVPCYSHKTGATLGLIGPQAGSEAKRLIANQYKRVRYRGSGFNS